MRSQAMRFLPAVLTLILLCSALPADQPAARAYAYDGSVVQPGIERWLAEDVELPVAFESRFRVDPPGHGGLQRRGEGH
jgi:hypothetical protein